MIAKNIFMFSINIEKQRKTNIVSLLFNPISSTVFSSEIISEFI